jgi:hypothetical protein
MKLGLLGDLPKGKLFLEIGSGKSTPHNARLAQDLGLNFLTVDMYPYYTSRATIALKKINPAFRAICFKGEDYVNTLRRDSVAIAYLDAYEVVPEGQSIPWLAKEIYLKFYGSWSNKSGWMVHLALCKTLHESRLIPGGFICINDVHKTEKGWAQGRGFMAIPWLLYNKYEATYIDGAIMLKKKKISSFADVMDTLL